MTDSLAAGDHNGSGKLAAIKAPSVPLTSGARKARAHGYRLRAEELRVISEDVILAETQQTLLGLAESYERMAEILEAAVAP
jgi:hypothetical protein